MPEQAQPQAQGQQGSWMSSILRMVMMYTMFSLFFRGKSTPQTDPSGKVIPPLGNLWSSGEKFDFVVYLSESAQMQSIKDSVPIWTQQDLYYDWRESNNREIFIDYHPSKNVQNNGSVFIHTFFTRSGYSHLPWSVNFDRTATIYANHQMNKYLFHKQKVTKNLISGEYANPVAQPDIKTTGEILSFWKPNISLHLIDDQTKYARGSIPPQFESYMQIDNELSGYFPVLYFDEFWLLKEHLIIINETLDTLPLSITYSPLSLMRWQFMLQMDQSFQMQQSMGTAVEEDSDEFKRMLVETNPYLLGLTMVVTILHSVFDFLAFKNDISFWKNKKSLEGLSVRTMTLNTIFQVVIFLYLVDNDTSWVILISSGIGLLIEFWKLQKAMIVKVDWTKRFPITIQDRESYASKTKEFDELAMKYLSWVLYPLVIGYSIYTLLYQTHKSWYSWILTSLTGCVYTFGFIMMTPQLFINYKLKSVAHLPWRTFAYKALNTFIDDLFAFIIKMPIMHRLSCFRDDIIFLIYLYQRWIYRIDYSRVNEFGQGGDGEGENATNKSNETKNPSENDSGSGTSVTSDKKND